jgi:hypothetical protein
VLDFHGAVVLQTNRFLVATTFLMTCSLCMLSSIWRINRILLSEWFRLSQIRPSGMELGHIMGTHKDLMHIHMHLLPKILACTMEAIPDMEITSSLVLTNSHSR